MFQKYLSRTIQHPSLSKINVDNLIVYSPSIVNAYCYTLKWIRYKKRGKMKKLRKQVVETKKEDFILLTSDVHIEIDFEILQSSMKDKFIHIMNHIMFLCKTHETTQNQILVLKNFQYVDDYDIYFHIINEIHMNKVIITNQITNMWEYIKKRKWSYSYIKIPSNNEPIINNHLQKLFVYSILKPFNIFEIRDKIYNAVIHLCSLDDIVWYLVKKSMTEFPDVSKELITDLVKELYNMRDLYQRDTYYIEWFVLSLRKVCLNIDK